MIRDEIAGFIGLINSINNEGVSSKFKKRSGEGNLGSRSFEEKIKVIKNVEEMVHKGRGSDRYFNHDHERSGAFRVSLDSRRKYTLNKLELFPTDTKFREQLSIELEPTKVPFRTKNNLYENYCEIMQKKHRRRVLKTLALNETSNHGKSIELSPPCNQGDNRISSNCKTTVPKSKILTPIFDFIRIRKSGQVKMKTKTFDGDHKKLTVDPTIDNLKEREEKESLRLLQKTRQNKVCKTEGNFLREQFFENSKMTQLDGWRFEEDKEFIGTENF